MDAGEGQIRANDMQTTTPANRRFRRRGQVVSREREEKLRRRLIGDRECWGAVILPDEPGIHEPAQVCSAAWADALFRDVLPDGAVDVIRIYDPKLYAPHAVCRVCGVPTPGSAMNGSGVCLDCHVGGADLEAAGRWREAVAQRIRQEGYGVSVSAASIARAEMYGARER